MTVVLDACAVLAYLDDEDGADLVEDILANETCYMHSVNICEVFCNVNSVRGPERADEALKWLLDTVGIRRVAEVPPDGMKIDAAQPVELLDQAVRFLELPLPLSVDALQDGLVRLGHEITLQVDGLLDRLLGRRV